MSWVPAAFAALLLLVVLYPFVEPHLTRERRARRAHRGGIVHWYPNYDEEQQFEPRMDRDIIPIHRSDLTRFGYHAGLEIAVVPRTFRNRVPGDGRFQLWKPQDESLRAIWICCWHGVEFPGESAGDTMSLTRSMLLRADTGQRLALAVDDAHDMPTVGSPLERWETEDHLPGVAATGMSIESERGVTPSTGERRASRLKARGRVRRPRNRTHKRRTRPSRTRR